MVAFKRAWNAPKEEPKPKKKVISPVRSGLCLSGRKIYEKYSSGNVFGVVQYAVDYDSDDPNYSDDSYPIRLDPVDPIGDLFEKKLFVGEVSRKKTEHDLKKKREKEEFDLTEKVRKKIEEEAAKAV